MQLWLTVGNRTDDGAATPAACPYAGCGGGRVRRFQTVAKRVRGTAGATTAQRFVCLVCRRTFRVYGAGIDRGSVPARIKQLAAGLHGLGLSYRDVGRALGVLGVTLGKSRIQALAAPLASLGQPMPCWLGRRGRLLERVEVEAAGSTGAAPRAWVWIDGRRHALRRGVDARGEAALVVDGIDRDLRYALDVWAGGMLMGFGVLAEVVYGGNGPRRRRAWSSTADGAASAEAVRAVEAGATEAGAEAGDPGPAGGAGAGALWIAPRRASGRSFGRWRPGRRMDAHLPRVGAARRCSESGPADAEGLACVRDGDGGQGRLARAVLVDVRGLVTATGERATAA